MVYKAIIALLLLSLTILFVNSISSIRRINSIKSISINNNINAKHSLLTNNQINYSDNKCKAGFRLFSSISDANNGFNESISDAIDATPRVLKSSMLEHYQFSSMLISKLEYYCKKFVTFVSNFFMIMIKFVAFMNSPIATHLDMLERYRNILSFETFKSLISSPVACRFGDDKFIDMLEHWYKIFDSKDFASFLSSVVCRLGNKKFTTMLENWRKILGDKVFVIFMSGSVASKLDDERFTDMLERYRLVLGDSNFFLCFMMTNRELLVMRRLVLGDDKLEIMLDRIYW